MCTAHGTSVYPLRDAPETIRGKSAWGVGERGEFGHVVWFTRMPPFGPGSEGGGGRGSAVFLSKINYSLRDTPPAHQGKPLV